MKTTKKIVVIDDDRTNNYVCSTVLKSICKPACPQICPFEFAEKGIAFIEEELKNTDNPLVLFLDIHMPAQLSGWDVLNRLANLPQPMQQKLTVYVLSSTERPIEKAKALGYRIVKNFIQKPLRLSMTYLKEDLFIDEAESIA